jgi:hypothetical protein
MWLEDLPDGCELNNIRVLIDGADATATYIGPRERDGLQQFNAILPKLVRTGLVEVDFYWRGERLCDPAVLRVLPPGPQVPMLLSVADGINLLSGTRIASRTVKVTVEETNTPEAFRAVVDGIPVEGINIFCADPHPPRYEINFDLPAGVEPGPRVLEMEIGRRQLGRVLLEVAP